MDDLISRQAAIDVVRAACGNDCDKSKFVYNALQDDQIMWLPDFQDINVGDMISRQAAIDALCKRCDLVADEDEPCTEKCNDIKILEMLPSAQPEIVRCKDCKHRASYWGNCRLLEEKYHQSVLVDGDSFCSMAERRTDERTD